MAIVYENVFYDFVLVPLKAIFDEEFSYGKIYIAPEILYKDPFSIRIWGNNGESVEYLNDAWQKQYNIEIFLYSIEKNPQENFYKQFYKHFKFLQGLIFIGMCARHYDSLDRQKIMYCTGIKILNECLEENNL